MSMSDEQFEEAMKAFDDFFITNMTASLRARDTAQREALARVEAENAEIRLAFGGQQMTLDECQAQLAEAVGLLRCAMESSSFREILTLERDIAAFLARIAQAEQQEAPPGWAPCSPDLLKSKVCCESAPRIAGRPGSGVSHYHPAPKQEAQGAQAGDERAAFEEWAHKNWPGAERKMLERDAHGSYVNTIYRDYFTGWMARAALATQPAAYVLTKDGEIYWEGDDGIVISNTTGDCLDDSYEWRPIGFLNQPAVRAAEHE